MNQNFVPVIPDEGDGYDVIHARVLRFFPELVHSLGGDPAALLAQAELSQEEAERGPGCATYGKMLALLETAATTLQCTDFGMRLANLQGGAAMFGPLGNVMRNSRTFGEALAFVIRHNYAHSLAASVWMRPLIGEAAVFVGHDILIDRQNHKAQAIEQIILVGNLAAMEMTGGYARAKRVHFRHQPVSALKTYRRNFGCDVLFGQPSDGMAVSEWTLACPIIAADAHAYRTAAAFIAAEFTRHEPPLSARARGVILNLVGSSFCTNTRVAQELKLHPRTLHRQLIREGTSFHRVKDEVRRDLAIYYLQKTKLDFAAISERLGFAEQAVLSRQCNRWFSATPTRMRLRSDTSQGQKLCAAS